MAKELSILVLSSLPTTWSGGLGKDLVSSLMSSGHKVDYLTKFGYENQEDYVINLFKQPLKEKYRKYGFLVSLKRFYVKLRGIKYASVYKSKDGIRIVNLRENIPPVATDLIISKITKKYDFVVTLFWEGMISAGTLLPVYEKLGCPIIIYSVDMFPMTGGCYYFQDCMNFVNGCGCCPALSSSNPKDYSNENYLYKKNVYSSIKTAFVGNSWMNKYALMSNLFTPSQIFNCSIVLNENVFKPIDKTDARKLLKLPTDGTFIMLCRYFGKDNSRKGYSYLKSAINLFCENLSESEKSKVALVFIGYKDKTVCYDFPFKVINLGKLSVNQLVAAYSSSDVFLSPTVVDAGPSMVNQSLMCGTPVVSFEIGTAIDVIENSVTGYIARYKDVNDYANGIMKIYNMKLKSDFDFGFHCREKGLSFNSLSVISKRIIEIYNAIK